MTTNPRRQTATTDRRVTDAPERQHRTTAITTLACAPNGIDVSAGAALWRRSGTGVRFDLWPVGRTEPAGR